MDEIDARRFGSTPSLALRGMRDRTTDRVTANPDHRRDVARGEPAALLADAEHRATFLARELHDAWLAREFERMSSLAGAVTLIGRANGAALRRSDLLTEKEAENLTRAVRAVVLRAEAVGRGDHEAARRRALRRLAEAAAAAM